MVIAPEALEHGGCEPPGLHVPGIAVRLQRTNERLDLADEVLAGHVRSHHPAHMSAKVHPQWRMLSSSRWLRPERSAAGFSDMMTR